MRRAVRFGTLLDFTSLCSPVPFATLSSNGTVFHSLLAPCHSVRSAPHICTFAVTDNDPHKQKHFRHERVNASGPLLNFQISAPNLMVSHFVHLPPPSLTVMSKPSSLGQRVLAQVKVEKNED